MRPLPRPHPRWRPRLRRPAPSTMLTVAATVATFLFVQSMAQGADDAHIRWGPTATARVAVDELAAGHLIEGGDVQTIDIPARLVPTGIVTTDPVGRTVRTRVGTGEILVEHRLSGPGASGTAALLDPEDRGVAVPRSGVDLALVVGDQVDVLATLDPSAGPDDPTIVLVEQATVIATDDETVTLAVAREQARTLTHALATATVTLTLVG